MKSRFPGLIGRSTTRKTRSERGAGGVEYALILGLIAVVALAALLGVGGKIRDIFSGADEQIALDGSQQPGNGGGPGGPGGPGGDSGDLPIVTVTPSSSIVAFNQQVTIDWTAENAFSVTSSYTLSGNCNTLSTFGPGPHDVTPLAGTIGTLYVDWTADLAGCDYELTISADNEAGTNFMARTVAIAMLDATPENLAFADTIDVEPNQPAESANATIADVDVAAVIAVTDPDAEVVSSSGSGASQTVVLGGQVRLRATAPSGFEQERLVPFTAGTHSGNWRIRTRAQDLTPDAFTIADVTGVEPSTVVQSAPVTITGIEGSAPISASNGAMVSVDGGPFLASTSIADSQSFTVETTSTSTFDDPTTTSVTVGDVSANWTVRTRLQDVAPDAFSFITMAPQNPGATVARQTAAVLAGFDGPLTVTTTNGAKVSKNGSVFLDSGQLTVNPGDTLWVQQIASTDDDDTPGSVSTNVTVGSTVATSAITTRDSIPSGLSFADLTDQVAGDTITSAPATLSAFDGPLTMTVSSLNASAQFRINGSPTWTNATAVGVTAQVNPSDTVELRVTAPAGGTTDVTVSIARLSGGVAVSDTWSVQAAGKAIYATPGTYSFMVPAGISQVDVKLWGAGGAGVDHSSASFFGRGGGGAYAGGTLTVSPGETLTITVAGGGQVPTTVNQGASGGGASSIKRGTQRLVVAAGGGGSSSSANGGAGGASVGDSGVAGAALGTAPTGGTQSAPGAAGTASRANGNPGSGATGGLGGGGSVGPAGGSGDGAGGAGGLRGGDNGGGGGGGGYFGGGSGGVGQSGNGQGGAGGSSYTGGLASGSASGGSGANPGNAGDADRGTAGLGGAVVDQTGSKPGNPGKVIITWTP